MEENSNNKTQLSSYKKRSEARKLLNLTRRISERPQDQGQSLELTNRMSITSSISCAHSSLDTSSQMRGRLRDLQQERMQRKLTKSLSRSQSKSILGSSVINPEQIVQEPIQFRKRVGSECYKNGMSLAKQRLASMISPLFNNQVSNHQDNSSNHEILQAQPSQVREIIVEDISKTGEFKVVCEEEQMIFNVSTPSQQVEQLRMIKASLSQERLEKSDQKLTNIVGLWNEIKKEHHERSLSRESSTDRTQLRHFNKNLRIDQPYVGIKSQSYVHKKHLAINIVDDDYQETHNFLENHDLLGEQHVVRNPSVCLNQTLNPVILNQNDSFNGDPSSSVEREQISKSLALLKRKQNTTDNSLTRKGHIVNQHKAIRGGSTLFTPEPHKSQQLRQEKNKQYLQKLTDKYANRHSQQPQQFCLFQTTIQTEQSITSPKKNRSPVKGSKQRYLQQNLTFQNNGSSNNNLGDGVFKSLMPNYSHNMQLSPQIQKKKFDEDDAIIEEVTPLGGSGIQEPPKQQMTFQSIANLATISPQLKDSSDRLQTMINNIKDKMDQYQQVSQQQNTPQKPSTSYMRKSIQHSEVKASKKDDSDLNPNDSLYYLKGPQQQSQHPPLFILHNRMGSQSRIQPQQSKLKQPTVIKKKIPGSTKQSQTDLSKLSYQIGTKRPTNLTSQSFTNSQVTTTAHSKRSSLLSMQHPQVKCKQ